MKISIKSVALVASVSIGTLIASSTALAQQQGPADGEAAPKAAPQGAPELGDIIVTARRSNENLQRVPLAVSVLSGDALAQRRVTGARDLQYNTPSLVVSSDPLGGSTAPVFQLRGQSPAQGSDDTVVTYLGDIPVNSRAFAGGLFDLQSVQVIRGPQGTLFGKNSTGGAVVFTPKIADTEEVSGFIDGTIGNYSYYQIGAGVNVPVIEGKLGLRVSGQIERRDGFTRNLSGPDGNDRNNDVVRVSLVATPTDELRNERYFSYYHGRQHQNPLIFTQYNYPLLNFVAGPALANPVQALFDRQQQLGPRTIDYSFRPNNDDNDAYIVSNTTSYDFGNVTLKNIFGYFNQSPKLSLSQNSTDIPLVDVIQNKKQHGVSEELQLSGDTPMLKWIVGGFYSREKTSTFQDAYLFGAPATLGLSKDTYTSKALFAQATYNFSEMGIEGLKFTAGLRHTWDKRSGILDISAFNFGTGQYNPVPTVANTISYHNWSWTVGLDYQVSPDVLLYVASRHSYKAGGLNLVAAQAPAELQTYAPEKLTDLELGAKATVHVGDAAIRTNLALYRGWYKSMQFQELARCNGEVATYVINAAKGSPKGLELEVDASVTRQLRVGGFYNRTLGKFDSFAIIQPASCQVIGAGVNLNGAEFGNISKDTAGVNFAYTVPLSGADEAIVLSGDWYYRSRRVGVATEGVNSAVPAYSLFNGRLEYNNIGGTRFSAGVWVRNIGNKLYTAYRNNVMALSGYDVNAYGDPRTFGMDVKFRF